MIGGNAALVHAVFCLGVLAAVFEVGANAPVPFRAYYTPEVAARPQARIFSAARMPSSSVKSGLS